MAFTLEDLLALPEEVQPEHAAKAGLTVPPPPPVPVGPQPPSPIAAATPAPAAPGPPAPIVPIDGNKFFKGLGGHPRVPVQPMPAAPNIEPDFSPNAGLGSVEGTEAYTKLPTLNFKQRQHLPTFSPGVPVNSEQFFNNKRERIEDQDANPMGSAENHPSWLGKAAHVAGKIGNVAGEILDPAATARIPESDLGRRALENQYTEQGDVAGKAEVAKQAEGVKERQEDTKEEHEQNYREHQLAVEKEADEKIANLIQGTKIKGEKVSNDNKKWMRAYGLQPNPDDPDGPPVDIPEDQMAPQEVQKMKLGQALMHAREARAAFDEYRANPTSPQAQAALMNARAHQQMAGAAATKAGVDQQKFMAEWLGLDRDGNPLAGAKVDETTGKPIGPAVTKATTGGDAKIAEGWEKNYNKPANDVETAYQMANQAYQDYLRGDAKTGANTMLMLSQHMNTTFGRVKGSRMNRDLIQEHRDAIGLGDKTELELGKLLGRGDQLTADQMREFMGLIKNMRDLTWETTTKEALRHDLPVDFLPQDEEALAKMPKPKDLRKPNTPTPKTGGAQQPPYDPKNPPLNALRQSNKTKQWEQWDGKQWQKTAAPTGAPQQ